MNGASVGSSGRPSPAEPAGSGGGAAGRARPVPGPRRLARLLWAAGAGLVLWTVYLALTLPERETAEHWDLAWIGLDVCMIATIGVAGWGAWRQRVILMPASAAAAVLLLVDAWFDTTTASGGDAVPAYLMAALIEIPGAVFFAWVARRAMVTTVARVLGVPADEVHLRDLPIGLDGADRADRPGPPTAR